MAKRKCKNCGRVFVSRGAGDFFCSPLCKATGYFVGGGGDTSKPGVAKAAQSIPVQRPMRIRKDDEKFARVRHMFTLPVEKRWEIAKDFSEEEQSYAKRLERRRLMEEDRIFREWDWNADSEDETGEDDAVLGDSDDGSL